MENETPPENFVETALRSPNYAKRRLDMAYSRQTVSEKKAVVGLIDAVRGHFAEEKTAIDDRIAVLRSKSYAEIMSDEDIDRDMLLVMVGAALAGLPNSPTYAEKVLDRKRGKPRISVDIGVDIKAEAYQSIQYLVQSGALSAQDAAIQLKAIGYNPMQGYESQEEVIDIIEEKVTHD